jgi:hypothetical protein
MSSTEIMAVTERCHLTSLDTNLDPNVADDMRDRATRIRKMQQDAVVGVGRQLLAAKEQIEHGCFLAWVQSACQMHIRTAQRAMQATEMVERNDKLSFLSPDGLLVDKT